MATLYIETEIPLDWWARVLMWLKIIPRDAVNARIVFDIPKDKQ